VVGGLTAGHLFLASDRLGKSWRNLRDSFQRPPTQPVQSPFNILQE
jgi:hypothetical protein